MPQDLLSDPRTEFAATLAASGLPLLARAVAAGAIAGPGVRAVLDQLASLAADGYDDAALAEAEEFLTSIAAATDPMHVAQELRLHCDEVLRPHLDMDADDELDDEVWPGDLEPGVAGIEVAANVEAGSNGTPPCEIAIDATATDPSPAIRSAVEVPTPDDGRNGEVGAVPSPVGGPTLVESVRVVPRPPSRGRSEDAAPSVASRVGSRTPAGRGRPVPGGSRVGVGRARVARAGSRHSARRARAGDPPPVRRDLRRHRLDTRTAADRPRCGTTPGHAAAGRTDRHGRTGRAPPAVPAFAQVRSPTHPRRSTPRRPDRPSHPSGTRSRSDGRGRAPPRLTERPRRLAERPSSSPRTATSRSPGTCGSISGTSKSGPSSDVEQRLLAGELLPGWDDGWVEAERERFRQLRLHALEDLCADHRRSGRFADAYAWAAR